MLFTCTLVRSRPDSNEGVRCETRSVGTRSKILVGRSKQETHLERETRRRLSLSLDPGNEGRIREVFKKMAVQVGTSHNYVFLSIQLPRVLLVCLTIIYIQELIHDY